MKKKIIFLLDSNSLGFFNEPIYCTYFNTEEAIKREESPIITSDLSHLSFNLEDLGYEIYICYDGKLTHFYTGMSTVNGKELRKAHNLIRLFLGGALDDDLGISRKSFVNEEYVDLGLPSGTLWAKCNLGAEKESDFGLFYQWGDTKGYKGVGEHQFNWDGYKYGSWNKLSKYNKSDKKLILDNEDDPVFVATKGVFKLPTKEQLQELIDHTNHEWTTIDGVKGMRFVNKNDDTKYIFIPAAGYCYDGGHYGVGSWGYVWSASRLESYASGAWYMYFDAGDVDMNYLYYRCSGFSVRGILNK